MTVPPSRNGVTHSTRLALSPQSTLQPLGDTEGGVVLKLDSGELFTVNDTSLAFLQELDGTAKIDDVAGRLAEIFDVDAATLTSDLIEIADDLIDESLIYIV
ncbi:coenzyme PQQ synthesis protein D (PqqD) [Hoeflea marina]|uniref:Coenzyme PQQ synthesis protein D (PqqD) n=1 Tax=Hoeflea marina TaxID=274592 RepID=A0A317PIR3_9HYPH|nr:PqqD family protein [Hoeflea marina]PWV99899.1 coenzyme PQQ synthesis protein D (PqqD) [Hoeflea marina]